MNSKEFLLTEATEISPHNKALYESGKKMLIDSISVGIDFCKFMITTSISAIPIYIGLIKLLNSDKFYISSWNDIIYITPILLYIFSTVIFVTGLLPTLENISLDLPKDIAQARARIITRRHTLAVIGFIIFIISLILSASLLLIKFI